MKLASYIRPFDVNQKIYVLGGDYETEELKLAPLTSFDQAVMELTNIYNIDELELHGDEAFCEKIKDRVAKAELSKYNKNQIKIVIKGV